MLIEFRSVEAGKLLMFGDVAVTLLKLMGMTGNPQGGIKAADIPAAIARLEAALREGAEAPHPEKEDKDEEKQETHAVVGLRQRAVPLIEFLRRSAAKDADVMWDKL